METLLDLDDGAFRLLDLRIYDVGRGHHVEVFSTVLFDICDFDGTLLAVRFGEGVELVKVVSGFDGWDRPLARVILGRVVT